MSCEQKGEANVQTSPQFQETQMRSAVSLAEKNHCHNVFLPVS